MCRFHCTAQVHQQYWDLYPDASQVATAKHPVRSSSQPLIAFHGAGFTLPNGTTYPGNPDLAWPVEVQQIARKAYYTAITQTDAQVGRVLDELDTLGFESSTVVVVSADHGWQLGEHGLWDKQTEFELATRVPLLIKVPWAKPSVGRRFDQFVELVDLHATLADLAGLPATPPTPLPQSVAAKQSQSFASIFTNPEKDFKNASFSQWPVCTKVANASCMACTGPLSSRAVLDSMGYSIRTCSVNDSCQIGSAAHIDIPGSTLP
jgi:iduronate 2-sulfatase